ncbi:response regulator, partial [Oxalobacteraceae bacterium OM1]
ANAGGSVVDRGEQGLVLRGVGLIRNLRDLGQVVVAAKDGVPVLVRDLGLVTLGHRERHGVLGLDHNPDTIEGITLLLKNENPSRTLAGVHEAVRELNEQILPKDVSIVPFIDRTDLIEATVHTVSHTLLAGMVLVSLVLLLFLGSPRAAAIVALTIPLSLLTAFILMHHVHIPANMVSLGAIDFGIIVDGSIVVMENILRRREAAPEHELLEPEVLGAARQVARPIFFGMLVIITAYLPLFAFQRIEYKLFSPMAFAVGFALIGALLAALLLATAAAVFFGRRVVRAIQGAKDAASALGRGEVPEAEASGVMEVDELQRALIEASAILLSEQASRRQAELERQYLFVKEQEARRIAEGQNKAKDTFLAMLGHELRNPLSAISAGTEVVRRVDPASPAAARAYDIIARQGQHLERIVNDLLDTSRMLSGKVDLATQATDLADVVEQCVEALKVTGRCAEHEVTVHTEPAWVQADRTRLDQIVGNLVVNAMKYTPAGGRIDIAVRRVGREAVLTVADSGIGIDDELMKQIFEPFVQGSVSLDRAQGGLGLGLTLVRELVRLHGGTVEAHSAGPGQGSVFTVRLPMLETDTPGEGIAANKPHAARNRVLLVEDNPDAREMTTQMLELAGFQVIATANGRDGVEAAKTQHPDVAIVDIGLPDINGFEVARALRADPQTRGMGLVAVSGYGRSEDMASSRAAGFDAHLVKPVRYDSLRETLAHWVD